MCNTTWQIFCWKKMSKQINVKEGNYFRTCFFFFCIKSEAHLLPVIVLLPWFSTKLPDISAGHIATTGTAHSNNKAFTTNAKFQWLLLPHVRGLWQVGKENLFFGDFDSGGRRVRCKTTFCKKQKLSGFKQRWQRKWLFTQQREIAAADVPLKMSQWMWENECALERSNVS